MPVYKDLRAKIGWTRMSHTAFLGFLWKIYVLNVHNANFPNPPISFPDFLVIIQNYDAAVVASGDGSRVVRSQRDKLRVAAAKMATLLAHYITHTAAGDQAVFATSGLELIATSRKKPQQPDIPEILKLVHGPNSGTMNIWLSPSNRQIKSYRVRCGPVDAGVDSWTVEVITRAQFPYMIRNLTPAVRYGFQASALGVDGWTDFCDPIIKITV
jgi:hypothetical protein